MGMGVRDFECLFTDEWEAACKAWARNDRERQQGRWERARWLGARLLQPWARKALRPEDLGRFPWEGQPATDSLPSKEEARRRMDEAIRKMGATF